jgi:hypothetical protein
MVMPSSPGHGRRHRQIHFHRFERQRLVALDKDAARGAPFRKHRRKVIDKATRIAELVHAFDMADCACEKLRQPDRVGGLLRHQRIGPDAGRLGDGILHQPVQPDHLRALQLAPSRQRLRRVLAMMQKEL